MDAGAGGHPDRAVVPGALHAARHLLHRIGFTPQVPAHRAAERDEAAIAAWRDVTWVKLRGGGDRGVPLLRGRLVNHEEQPGQPRILLKRIQYRPALIDGFLAQTGLSLEPEPP